MKTRNPEALATLYEGGLTQRQIAAHVGVSHQTVRYHLRKLKRYPEIVTRLLLERLREAEAAYAITRARDERRRFKHCLAMLRQKRPSLYERWRAEGAPKTDGLTAMGREYKGTCRDCKLPGWAYARRRGKAWLWRCHACEAEWKTASRPFRLRTSDG